MTMMLIDGQLREKPKSSDGQRHQLSSDIRNWIEADHTAPFPAEANRYHLYTSHACPWCHRVMVMRALMGLENVISVSEVHPFRGDKGWRIDPALLDETAGVPKDTFLYETYLRTNPSYTGPISVPLLIDKKTGQIVSNNSADIMRMLNRSFGAFAGSSADFYPAELAGQIDQLADYIQTHVNSGVYKTGFASTQAAYDKAVRALFDALDVLDQRLERQRYLLGARLTEVDWKLFVTLIRFDAVYVTHFKTDLKRLSDFTNLNPYLRELYQIPGISGTVNFQRMREHYFRSHLHLNPNGIVSIGPQVDLRKPHGRELVGVYQKGAD